MLNEVLTEGCKSPFRVKPLCSMLFQVSRQFYSFHIIDPMKFAAIVSIYMVTVNYFFCYILTII